MFDTYLGETMRRLLLTFAIAAAPVTSAMAAPVMFGDAGDHAPAMMDGDALNAGMTDAGSRSIPAAIPANPAGEWRQGSPLALRWAEESEQIASFDTAGFDTAAPVTTNLVTAGGSDSAAIAAVPEPATWAMMLVGFGLLGATMRRRGTGPVIA